MHILLHAFLCCLLILVAPIVAAAEVQFLSIAMSYQDDKDPEQKFFVIVRPNQQAVLTVQGDTTESAHRIRLNAAPATLSSKGIPYSNVSVQFLKHSADGWLVQSSLQIGAALDMPATMSAPDELKGASSSGLKLVLTASALTAEQVMELTGKSDLSVQDCPAEDSEESGSSSEPGQVDNKGNSNCCRANCLGSSYILTCCGAVNCCA